MVDEARKKRLVFLILKIDNDLHKKTRQVCMLMNSSFDLSTSVKDIPTLRGMYNNNKELQEKVEEL
ncbi:hypothetical protein COV16_00315 [Candidatus Woesearchaeota archaeon CG10_big_fil_rev_8_21_14_0_10_34_8]|nr:MAG: hypothetical protein COV16_00315 [Candidatus Woesearchaeota archaeon CG10_big_fil_rev_8_21_14_0_10_34_8]